MVSLILAYLVFSICFFHYSLLHQPIAKGLVGIALAQYLLTRSFAL